MRRGFFLIVIWLLLAACVCGVQPLAAAPAAAPTATAPAATAKSRTIRVGLSTSGGPIAFWSRFALTVSDPLQPARRLTVAPGEIVTLTLRANTQVVARGQRFLGPIEIRTTSGAFPAWQSARIWGAGQPTHLSTNGQSPRYQRAYRGGFEIAPQTFSFEPTTHRSPLRVVNVLPLDDYLQGVVPWEMDATAPLEALKAQAICARSETLAKLASGRHLSDDFDICDYDHCQGYPGTENEKAAPTRAVRETAGYALFSGGRIADAVYFTNSGGLTAAAGDVWRGTPEPYLQSVNDFSPQQHAATARLLQHRPRSEADWVKFCTQNLPSYAQPSAEQVRVLAARRRTSPRTAQLFGPDDLPEFYRWTRRLTPQQVVTALAGRTSVPFNSVTQLRVSQRAASGRIQRFTVIGRAANNASISQVFAGDSQIRALFSGRLGSTTALPSSLFVVLPQYQKIGQAKVLTAFVLKGAGWGHGAGMCQRGAQNHARDGWTARQILQHYFHAIELRRAY